MRICSFKKGQPVPEWVASVNSKWIALTFIHDVKIVKNGPWLTVHVTDHNAARELFEMTDNRPRWLRLFDRIRRKEYKTDLSKIKGYHYGPIDYNALQNKGVRNGPRQETEGEKDTAD